MAAGNNQVLGVFFRVGWTVTVCTGSPKIGFRKYTYWKDYPK